MPAVLTNKHCPSCNHKHTLCYEPDEFFDDKKEYTYTCPETQDAVTFIVGVVKPERIACPNGSVKIFDA